MIELIYCCLPHKGVTYETLLAMYFELFDHMNLLNKM